MAEINVTATPVNFGIVFRIKHLHCKHGLESGYLAVCMRQKRIVLDKLIQESFESYSDHHIMHNENINLYYGLGQVRESAN